MEKSHCKPARKTTGPDRKYISESHIPEKGGDIQVGIDIRKEIVWKSIHDIVAPRSAATFENGHPSDRPESCLFSQEYIMSREKNADEKSATVRLSP